ncbi:MAG: LysM peptidoglycan-binding domain-containing protein, partial [Nitrospirota bacterium]|nr:LysM peptidoglycan-binding domain-containing protein [Nitrospirota bacterium]
MQRKTLVLNITLILLLFFLLPSFSIAQDQEYKDYTVIKGDTLWDISKKELKDPFLWPKIWKENPDITNPDKIYPKQKIRIPLYILQKEISLPETPKKEVEIKKEEPPKEIVKKIEPVKKEYLVDKHLLLSSGYIAESIPRHGEIIDSQSGRNSLGKDDYAYIETIYPPKIGDKFYIIRSVEKVNHPESGDKLGYLIEIPGIAEVVSLRNNLPKVKITSSYNEILVGDFLINFYEIEPPLAIDSPRKPDINGYIVTTRYLRTVNGTWDIVYIDRGK